MVTSMVYLIKILLSFSAFLFVNFTSTNGCLKPVVVPENEAILKECILSVVEKVTKARDVLALLRNNSYPYVFTELVHNKKELFRRWSLIKNTATHRKLLKLSENFLKENVVDMFFIQIRDPEELNAMLHNLNNYYFFNPRVNFLITSTTKFDNITEALGSIFQLLWKANIYNTLVVLPNKTKKSKTDLYTWFPFGKNRCGDQFTKYKLINQCFNGKLLRHKALYPNKIPDKLNVVCRVKVRTVVWPPFVLSPIKRICNSDEYVFQSGFEIVLMNTIAKSMNLSLTYTLSEKSINWGEIYNNGTATGLQAYLLENEGDIGISSQAYTQDRLKFFDVGVPYFFEHLIWCVPQAETIPAWQKIIDVFSFGSWMLNVLAYMLFTLSIWVMSKFSTYESNIYKKISNCIQNSFAVLLGVTIFSVPKSGSVRLLFSFWFIFTMHLNGVYKTSLISMLASPVYEKQIGTVEDILNSNLRLQFVSQMRRYFDPANHSNITKEILEKWIDCMDLNDCMDRVAYTRDSVMLLPRLYLEFVKNRYKKNSHASYIYCFNGNIVTYPGSMLMRKGFPLRNRINELINRMVSAGLVEFWQKNALRLNLTFNKTSIWGSMENNKVITFNEQRPAFFCLITGLILAAIAFVCEIVHH